MRLSLDKSNCIVLTDDFGNVVTTITNVAKTIDTLLHLQKMAEVNEVLGTQIAQEGLAL